MLFVLLLFIRISLICSKIYSGSHAYLVILIQQLKRTKAHSTTRYSNNNNKKKEKKKSSTKTKPQNHWIVWIRCAPIILSHGFLFDLFTLLFLLLAHSIPLPSSPLFVWPSLFSAACSLFFLFLFLYIFSPLVPFHSFPFYNATQCSWRILYETHEAIQYIYKQIKPLYSISNWIDDIDK